MHVMPFAEHLNVCVCAYSFMPIMRVNAPMRIVVAIGSVLVAIEHFRPYGSLWDGAFAL